ncbi:MAG: ABC transporter permease, partial [Candidatus Eisenbacteria bacterium]
MGRIQALVRKEFRVVVRSRQMLGVLFVAPLVQLLVLGYAVTTEVKHVRLVARDLDGSPWSRETVRAFERTGRFDFLGYLDRREDALLALDAGRAD